MCFGLILAIPEKCSLAQSPIRSEMTLWPIANPWIREALGAGWETWLLGDSRHCSCGRIHKIPKTNSIALDLEALSFIVETANRAHCVAFLVHWFSGEFENEEVAASETIACSSEILRRRPDQSFPLDCIVWVGDGKAARPP